MSKINKDRENAYQEQLQAKHTDSSFNKKGENKGFVDYQCNKTAFSLRNA